MIKLCSIAFLALVFSSGAVAEQSNYHTVLDSIGSSVNHRVEKGRIQSIDMIGRTMVVSGFKYLLGPATIEEPLKVSMMGSGHGALELLKRNMFVEVQYLPSSTYRIARVISQIQPVEEY